MLYYIIGCVLFARKTDCSADFLRKTVSQLLRDTFSRAKYVFAPREAPIRNFLEKILFIGNGSEKTARETDLKQKI